MSVIESCSTSFPPSRALGILGAIPPVLIVTGAAALAYWQAPKLTGYFAAPPPVIPYTAPTPPIDKTPVAAIPTPAPAPVVEAPKVATPKPVVHPKPQKHVVHHAPVRQFEDDPTPVRHYVYPPYQRSYQSVYPPVTIPFPFIGGHGGGRGFGGGFGGFGRR